MRRGFVVLTLTLAFFVWWMVEQAAEASPHKVRTVKHTPMDNIGYEIADAFETLNIIREAMGMPALQENIALNQAAQAHADYLVRHHVSSHFETSTQEGFTGTKPVDRALRAGYKSRFVGENLSTKSESAKASVNGLFSAIYHRFGFLNLAFDEVGIGIAQNKNDPRNSAFVYVMGNQETNRLCMAKGFQGVGRYVYGICADTKHRVEDKAYKRARGEIKERNPKVILYPYDGQQAVPPSFYDEHPDPLPDYDVSGFPVSVEFNEQYFRKINLISFRLFEASGEEVTAVRLLDKRSDPNKELTRRQFALLPLKRLKYGTTYRAEMVYTHNKKSQTVTWSFTTLKPTEELKVIRARETTLTLKPGKSYWLYFVPENPHDVLGSMQYPGNIFIRFIDSNTMRIVLEPDQSKSFEIVGSQRRIRIEIE
jgi:uncharacterized protein YkwD